MCVVIIEPPVGAHLVVRGGRLVPRRSKSRRKVLTDPERDDKSLGEPPAHRRNRTRKLEKIHAGVC
jgi:hypothetical protein